MSEYHKTQCLLLDTLYIPAESLHPGKQKAQTKLKQALLQFAGWLQAASCKIKVNSSIVEPLLSYHNDTEDCRLVVSKAQNLGSAYQNICIQLSKQFYSSNCPITTIYAQSILHFQPDNQLAILCSSLNGTDFAACTLSTNLQTAIQCISLFVQVTTAVFISSGFHSAVVTCTNSHFFYLFWTTNLKYTYCV